MVAVQTQPYNRRRVGGDVDVLHFRLLNIYYPNSYVGIFFFIAATYRNRTVAPSHGHAQLDLVHMLVLW